MDMGFMSEVPRVSGELEDYVLEVLQWFARHWIEPWKPGDSEAVYRERILTRARNVKGYLQWAALSRTDYRQRGRLDWRVWVRMKPLDLAVYVGNWRLELYAMPGGPCILNVRALNTWICILAALSDITDLLDSPTTLRMSLPIRMTETATPMRTIQKTENLTETTGAPQCRYQMERLRQIELLSVVMNGRCSLQCTGAEQSRGSSTGFEWRPWLRTRDCANRYEQYSC